MRWMPFLVALLVIEGCGREPLGSIESVSSAEPAAAVCRVIATGTLPAGDTFDGDATLYADESSDGTWTHIVPEHDVDLCAAEGANPGHCEHGQGLGLGHTRHGNGNGYGHDKHHTGTATDVFEGTVENVACFINGHAIGEVSGTGSWNGISGYTFEAEVSTSALGDSYSITIYDASSAVVYTTTDVPATGTISVGP